MSEQKTDQERTEEPTQRKLEKAREDGNVSISKEISSVLLMIVSVIMFLSTGSYMYNRLEALFETFSMNSIDSMVGTVEFTEFLETALWFSFEMTADRK